MSTFLTQAWLFAGSNPPGVGDPGVRNVNLDEPLTAISVSDQAWDLTNTDAGLAAVVVGNRILAQEQTDAGRYVVADVVAEPVDHGTWWEIPVQLVGQGNYPRRDQLLQLAYEVLEDTPGAGWPYATVAQLAAAIRIRVTDDNRAALQRCLDAAAEEIDADLDRLDPLPVPTPAAITATNIARAVEWWKAADAAYGIIGFEDTGAIRAPRDGFARHAATLTPWKQQWGVA